MSSHKSVFLISCLLLAGLLLAACSNTPAAAQKKIDKIAQNMKATLPKMLDSDTRLVNVYTKKLELVSEYELVNYESDGSEDNKIKNKIRVYLKTQVCQGIKTELLKKGISARYVYKDNNGRIIGDWLIAPGDC